MREKRERIGEILIRNKYINKDMLDEALAYQRMSGCNITDYLLTHGYLNENDLAKCIAEQFRTPYLSLKSYKIPSDIIQTIPVETAEKYWLIPIEKIENSIILVMVNPLNARAIEEVEKITGCKVQKFVGLLSEIRRAIESYYEVVIPDIEITKQKCVPLFIETNTYKGFDRRRAIRFKASVETHFPIKELYEYTQTKDISACGLLIESKKQLRLGSYLVLELDLPREEHPFPIPLLAQIVRIASLKNGNFDIGMEFIKVFQEDLRLLIHHAHTQANKAAKEPSKGLLNKNTAA